MMPGFRNPLRAAIFDVDGTLAETERDGHRPAFNQAFRDYGLHYAWGVVDYGELLTTTGGRERLRRFLAEHGHAADAETLAALLHTAKTAHFLDWVHGSNVHGRAGAHELMKDLRAANVALAIATTGSRA